MVFCSWNTKWISMIFWYFFVFILVIPGKFASGYNYKVNLNNPTTKFLLQVNTSIEECQENKKMAMFVNYIDMLYETSCNIPTARANLSSSNDERRLLSHIQEKCNYHRNCSLTKSDFLFNSTCDNRCSCPYLYYIVYSCKLDERATTHTTQLSTVTSVKTLKERATTQTTHFSTVTSVTTLKSKTDPKVQEEGHLTVLICAVSACVVIAVIIITFLVICLRRRRDRQQRAVYHKDDEYATIDATSKKKNTHQDQTLLSTSASVRKPSACDGDNSSKNDMSQSDEQYAELASTSKGYARVSSKGHSKTKETTKHNLAKSTNDGRGEDQTILSSASSDETEQKEEVAALYSTVNKLKKKSVTDVDPVSASHPASDAATELNDVYSHFTHLTQRNTETENVYNG